MRFCHGLPLSLLLVAVPVALAQAPKSSAADDLAKFEGNWVLVSGKKDGQSIAADSVSKSKIAWKGKDIVIESPHQAKEPIKAAVTLGNGSPRAMEWVRVGGPDAGKTMRAVYEFRGPDEYVVVFAPAERERPKELDAKAGSGHTLHVWRRVKP
jgi:uncharacterized protein (TIGR03067 family)